jgi:uncharacterized protein YcnI
MNQALARVLVIACTAATTILLAPTAPAAAHVTVTPATVTAGGRATLTFKVPNESSDARTTQLEVFFPESAAPLSVSLRPVPDWTATIQRRSLPAAPASARAGEEGHAAMDSETVTGIVWRSQTGIGVGEFQTFDVAVGPLPKEPTSLVFKAVQTYSDGEVVRWIDVASEGGPRPAHPAMVVSVVTAPSAVPVATQTTTTGGDGLSWAGLAIAGLALGVAVTALLRRRPGPARR